jgi:hypothetical protein
MIGKCPVCGYTSRENKEHIRSKSELLNRRHIEVRMSIATVSKFIRNNRTNDNSDEKEIRFLTRIIDVRDEYVYRCIRRFMYRNLHLKGYGFDYLIKMINSESRDIENAKKNEKAIMGTNPTTVKEL